MSSSEKQKKVLVIAVDPGFDGIKVTVNGELFRMDKDITDQTNNDGNIGLRNEGYYSTRYMPGKIYIVGSFARKLKQSKTFREEEAEMRNITNSTRYFTTTTFEIAFITAVGAALINYEKVCVKKNLLPAFKVEELKEWEIYLGIALPHTTYTEKGMVENMRNLFAKEYHFEMETHEIGKKYLFDFKIKEENCTVQSQAIMAMLGMCQTDEGDIVTDSEILNNIPAIMCDAGYKTVGIYEFTAAQTINSATSNTDFAMSNINARVSEALHRKYTCPQVTEFTIENIINDENGVINVMTESGKSESIDIMPVVKEEREKVFTELVTWLCDKFDNLLYMKQIILAGGTGRMYYDYFVDYCKENRPHLKVALTEYEFNGNKISPVYAVSVGLYKTMLNLVKMKQR